MSRELGWILHEVRVKSYTGLAVLDFIKRLRRLLRGHLTLLLDNASIHTCHAVQDWCNENEVRCVWLPPYCPEFQPIELAWAQVKLAFKKEML